MVALITPAEKPFARELATFYAQRSSAMFSRRVLGVARRFQEVIDAFFIGGPFHGFPQLAVAGTSAPHQHQPFPVKSAVEPSEKSFLDTLRDGFLWAVPKKRTSLEKRVKKQFGKSYMDKFRLRTDLIVCLHCGNHHEAHALCGHCYEKVKKETKLMQETMNVQAREPEIQSQEVVVLYEGESADPSTTQGKRIVEMPKQRPLWFNSTLLTKVVPKKAAE